MRKLILGLLGVVAALVVVSGASAAVPGPGLTIYAVAGPTVFSSEHNGKSPLDTYSLTVRNSGSKPTDGSPIVISDELPLGMKTVKLEGQTDKTEQSLPMSCVPATATCTYNAPLPPGESLVMSVGVIVEPGTVGPVTNSAFASGGGAPSVSANVETAIGTAAESVAEPFGLAAFEDQVAGVDGLNGCSGGRSPV